MTSTHAATQIQYAGRKTVHIIGAEQAILQTDAEARSLWWFGSAPPEGIPLPVAVMAHIHNNTLSSIAPPWACIVKGTEQEGIWLCTDYIGLQHLYIRYEEEGIFTGADCLSIAQQRPTHIDPIGAFELMTRGNPQGGRTLFTQVKLVAGGITIKLGESIAISSYWTPPEPEPIASEEIIKKFSNAVCSAITRHYHKDDVQELTAGRDSLMLLSAYLKQGIPIRTWTHGFRSDSDLTGARHRANHFGIPHQTVALEQLCQLDSESILHYCTLFFYASGGMANVMEYWHLPWILEQLQSSGSISGVGGEVFRGFYYEWVGKGKIPRWLGEKALLHGKVREQMPLTHPFVDAKIGRAGSRIIAEDVRNSLKASASYWNGLDMYYLRNRMHFFAGTTFSAVGRWKKVRLPLFDPNVVDCLKSIPIEMRGWSSGITRMATAHLLGNRSLPPHAPDSYETGMYRMTRLMHRLKQLHGTWVHSPLAELLIKQEKIRSYLDFDSMKTTALYTPAALRTYVGAIFNGAPLSLPLGAILTIEMAAQSLGSAYCGVSPCPANRMEQ